MCKVGETVITDTKDLAIGQHEMVCTVISIEKNVLTASDTVEIYEEITPKDETIEESEE